MSSSTVETAILRAPGPTREKIVVTNRVFVAASVIILLSLLAVTTWRELAHELDASIRDFASSLDTHHGTDWR